jgi:indolepyruvate ferredoxin oxidoreductase beta subunit
VRSGQGREEKGVTMNGLNFLIAGVGGQGTVVASDILSDVGSESGYDVKKSDILGLAVRGGSVVSHVRWAERVHAPMIEEGAAHYLIGFEWLETLRRLSYVHSKGTVIVNDCRLDPITVSSGEADYPEKESILAELNNAAGKVYVIPGLQTALDLGNARTLNIVVMGALSKLLEPSQSLWEEIIRKRIPKKLVDLNLEVFRKGRALIQ